MAAKKKGKQLLIQCYGLFWRERDVDWGYAGVKGRLLGVPATNKTSAAVDFREQTGIYVLCDNFKVLYVGQAGYGNAKLFDRLKSHLNDNLAQRWNRFSWFGLRWVKVGGKLAAQNQAAHPAIGDVLNHMEAILIAATEPALNRQGGRWGRAVQYLQAIDKDLEPDPEGKISEIWEWVEGQKTLAAKVKNKKKS